uniref:AN1-type domain-containing protein n=1 Tax=Plectus sambesii TaxID=2011161 RepID=A0A914XMT1_9BILA
MAEFPDLGQHCTFGHCQQLDFLPFHCNLCGQDFCKDHKAPHSHDCPSSRNEEADSGCSTSAPSKPLKPFCCSYASCSNNEAIKIICPFCELNYCLSHRHVTDHQCPHDPAKSQRPSVSLPHRPQPPTSVAAPPPHTETKKATVNKVLNAAQQQRADRLVLMKLKMKAGGAKDAIPESERLFILVILPDSADKGAVAVSNKWTVGKCYDQVIKTCNVDQKSDSNTKKLRLYMQDCSEAMDMSKNITDAGVTDGMTLELRYE